MNRLLYSSVSVVPLEESELDVLLGASRQANAAAGITGVLVHVISPETAEAGFVQLLEGEPAELERTYARIVADDLHTDLTVLLDGPAPGREFAAWTMRLVELSLEELRSLVGQDQESGPCAPAALGDLVRDPGAMLDLVHRLATSPAGTA